MNDAAEQKLARMDEERAKLQSELDKEKERSRQLVGGVGVAADWADSLAEANPRIDALAEALAALIEEFEVEVDLDKLSKVDDLRFRLTKATLANAQHRYAEVPILVPVKEAVAEFQAAKDRIEHAATQINRAIDVNQVLGDGLSGLREWRQALACYERLLELRPDRWATRNDAAICLLELGQLSPASIHLGEIVAHFTELVEQEGRTELRDSLVNPLALSGLTLHQQGKSKEAIDDLTRAIGILEQLVSEGRSELKAKLQLTRRHLADVTSKERGE